jgi:hypothetical protein
VLKVVKRERLKVKGDKLFSYAVFLCFFIIILHATLDGFDVANCIVLG